MESLVTLQKSVRAIGALNTQCWRDHCSTADGATDGASFWALREGLGSAKTKEDSVTQNCQGGQQL